jgi:hypothetical protein
MIPGNPNRPEVTRLGLQARFANDFLDTRIETLNLPGGLLN